MRVAALVLAAGLSSRMDGFKPLLPLMQSTVLGHGIRTLREAGIDDILVVAGHNAREVLAESARLRVECVVNRDYAQGMFSSVLAGLAVLGRRCGALLVMPVDIPLVLPQTIKTLLGCVGQAQILYPTFSGERGHPPVIASGCVPFIESWQGQGGLRAALEGLEHLVDVQEIPVADSNIVFDLDTPEDYRQALRRVRRKGHPSVEEAYALLALHGVSGRGLAHGRAVVRIALAIADALGEKRGWPFDRELVHSAALMHDIAKGQRDHEARGGHILDMAGFPYAARIVEAHRDICLPDNAPITEREVVYLADKLVSCDRPVSVRRRFQEKLDRFGKNPEAYEAISGRRDRALAMLARVERESGMDIKSILELAGFYIPGGH